MYTYLCVCVCLSLVLVLVVAVVDVGPPSLSETQNKQVEERRNLSGVEPSGCVLHLGPASMSCRMMVGVVRGGVWHVGPILAMWASHFLLAEQPHDLSRSPAGHQANDPPADPPPTPSRPLLLLSTHLLSFSSSFEGVTASASGS